MLVPFMPHYSKVIQGQLNAPDDCYHLQEFLVCQLRQGHKIGTPVPLFRRIENAEAEELKTRFAGKKPLVETVANGVAPENVAELSEQITKQVRGVDGIVDSLIVSPRSVESLFAFTRELHP